MKTRHIAFLVWLAGASWAGAQMHDAPSSSIIQTYGASPSSSSQIFQDQPKPVPQSAASTSNTTVKPPGTNIITSMDPTPDATAPALTGNVPGTPAFIPAPLNSTYTGADLTNFPMPETMAQIDNNPQHTLNVQDQFVYQVPEDHNKPQMLFVDEQGEISQVPYLPDLHMKVEGRTLYEVAQALKAKLEDPQMGYYKRATVLLAFYKGNGSRGHVDVIGEVVKQGSVDVPADNVLTLFQAISSAGGFKDSADKEHVQIIHHDPDPSKVTKQEVNYQKILDEGREPDILLQPGDFINVPSKSERPQEDIMVVGEVTSMAVLPPPSGTPLYLSQVMIKVGFTPWSNHTVDLVRYVDGKKTETFIDVDQVIVKGNKEKDVQLQAGDVVIVKRNWYSF
jgi:protein involved in polysaccharide export with SLBB domain